MNTSSDDQALEKLTGQGGAGRGQGRKKLLEPSVFVGLRMTAQQKQKLAKLGGAQWVRGKIDKARAT